MGGKVGTMPFELEVRGDDIENDGDYDKADSEYEYGADQNLTPTSYQTKGSHGKIIWRKVGSSAADGHYPNGLEPNSHGKLTFWVVPNNTGALDIDFGFNVFRFRGVIVGNNNTIINKTPYPFIAYSGGNVVKDLTIKVDTSSIKDNRITCRGDSKKYVELTQSYNQIRAYGAVFGQIVGGDNVIDNVQLDLSKINIYMNGDKGQYVPVGGYVGVIIDGGLVFRNMSGSISGLTDNTRVISLEEKILLIIFKPEKIKRNYAFLNFMCNMLIIRHLVLYFTALVAGQLTLDNGNKTCSNE